MKASASASALVVALAVLALPLVAEPAFADRKGDADALFKKGKKLQGDKKYVDACVLFEKSDALDPAIGTKLNAARCYEEWGKLASAHTWYLDAERMAEQSGDKRLDKIREVIAELDPDVPRLTVKVAAEVDLDAAEITLDRKLMAASRIGTELRVDPGPHELVYFSNGEKKSKMIAMERGGEREITLDIPPGKGRSRKQPGSGVAVGGADASARPGRTRRIIGVSMGAAGLVGIGVASYLTLDARGTYNDALDAHCMGMPTTCSPEGLVITGDARSQANLATIITLASVAVIGGGVVLYLTAPRGATRDESAAPTALYVTPVIHGGGGGLVLGGGF
ncbi:MAG: hypothetical protein M3680_10740 [Myxococcota bacterium]|nr:hypothetical protein [Myxococcota bacterium]